MPRPKTIIHAKLYRRVTRDPRGPRTLVIQGKTDDGRLVWTKLPQSHAPILAAQLMRLTGGTADLAPEVLAAQLATQLLKIAEQGGREDLEALADQLTKIAEAA